MNRVFALVLVASANLVRAGPAPQLTDSDLDRSSDTLLRQKIEETPFRLSQGMTDFALNLYNAISDSNNGNVVLSPFSLHTALSMTYFGSPEESETHQELARLLGLPKDYQTDYPTNYLQLLSRYDNLRKVHGALVKFANKIYTNTGFQAKEDFLSLLHIFYRTTQEELNFSDGRGATDTINDFVSTKTNGLIPDLLSPSDVDGLTRMILVNAIYFKADWLTQFERKDTEPHPWKLGEERFQFPTMRVDGEFGVSSMSGYRVLEMPYSDRNISMLVFLPNKNSDVRQLGQSMRNLDMSNIFRNMVYGHTDVRFPTFEMEAKQEMAPILAQLGVRTLFDTELADLSDITTEEKVAVSKIVHQAKLKVTEEGSEAAASSAVAIGTRTVGQAGPKTFYADRPFIFVIYDKVFNIPLFMGRVVDPSGRRQLPPSSSPGLANTEAQPLENPDDITERRGSSSSSDGSQDPPEFQRELPNCSEIGYLQVQHPHISFPCKGFETMPVREHEARQRQEQEARRARYLDTDDSLERR